MKVLIAAIALLIMVSCSNQKVNESSTGKTEIKINIKMDSRDILMERITKGMDTTQVSDNSDKSILARGCDPEMGRRSIKVLPPVLALINTSTTLS